MDSLSEGAKNVSAQDFKTHVIRAFTDGDYVFAETEYDVFGPKIGVDAFPFKKGYIAEHGDLVIEISLTSTYKKRYGEVSVMLYSDVPFNNLLA